MMKKWIKYWWVAYALVTIQLISISLVMWVRHERADLLDIPPHICHAYIVHEPPWDSTPGYGLALNCGTDDYLYIYDEQIEPVVFEEIIRFIEYCEERK